MSLIPRRLEDAVFASGQITPDDMASLVAAGIVAVVNHRPDDEEPGQPTSESLEAAALAAGLGYSHAAVRGLPDGPAVAATQAVLDGLPPGGRVLLFCRSGMRSTAAWAMVRAGQGEPPQGLRDRARQAGYDIGAVPL